MNQGKFSVDEMVLEAKREVTQRRKTYPRLVHEGRLTEEKAARAIALMKAIADHLEREIAPEFPL